MSGRVFDVLVVGGGHAGIEAALAAARLGCQTALVTHDRHEIGRMPCNPAIGGLGKGQLVREIDVLGGQMGMAIDATGIQFRILNQRKGPAVRSPRAQADKHAYQFGMSGAVARQERLTVIEAEASGLLSEEAAGRRRMCGVRTAGRGELEARRVILSTGTFLRGLMHVGERRKAGGREGADSAEGLSGDLAAHGFVLQRLKTGTPMRLRRGSIDFGALATQAGDPDPRPFSFRTRDFAPEQVICHITWTNERTHALIRENLHQSPLYAGVIEGRGPRYCPSVEDKVVRFGEKDRHQLFLEPEGVDSDEIYVNGLSTSLPAEVQVAMVRTIQGLEEAELARFGYAVEYDSVPSWQVTPTLQSKNIDGLYLAGQILGTSGYEEAAAQGIVAGVNAANSLNNQSPLILGRNEAYIGVLIDDLVTKEISEPYRMFTSRAEHRLSLRCDNAEMRLLAQAERIGLLPRDDIERLREHVRAARTLRSWLGGTFLPRTEEGKSRILAADLVRRPEGRIGDVLASARATGGRDKGGAPAPGPPANEPAEDRGGSGDEFLRRQRLEMVEADLKYDGYITKQEKILERLSRLDQLPLPPGLPYREMKALSFEAREKLDRMQPGTLGQASRIDGVRQADLAVLAVFVQKGRHTAPENHPRQ